MLTNTIYTGSALQVLRTLPEASIHCCVTSPPYYGLRDYGHADQIGLEPSPEQFIAKLVAVFSEVRRILKPDGTIWVNIGDSYAQGKIGRDDTDAAGSERLSAFGHPGYANKDINITAPVKQRKLAAGLKPKDLIGIPWMLAFALRADGWYLRQDIIWHKPNPMPESVTDRCTKSHEYIFLLSKSRDYYYDIEAMREPAAYGNNGSQFHTGKTADHQLGRASKKRGEFTGKTNAIPGREAFRAVTETRNRRSVWSIATQPYTEAHFATFPEELPRLCISAGCPENGIVLDPFFGAGTTGLAALQLGRRYIGIEINSEYTALAQRRLAPLQSQTNLFATNP